MSRKTGVNSNSVKSNSVNSNSVKSNSVNTNGVNANNVNSNSVNVNANSVFSGAIGIDLGTTFSCVGVWQNGRVEIIPNEHGNRTTPSYVAYTEHERLIGESAKSQMTTNPQNTVFDVKRLIGRKFTDATVQEDIKNWPFRVTGDINNRPRITVTYKEDKHQFLPEEISAAVLTKMRMTAETYLGQTVKKAVITVPAYFNDAQRVATRNAGTVAGLEVLRIINEPTAAALAYGLDHCQSLQNVVIFDMGGGTTDVTVLTIEDGVFQVRSTCGDTHLGGEDLDNRLVEYFLEDIKKRHDRELEPNGKAARRLRSACERLKRNLSSSQQGSIELESLFEGVDFFSNISRLRFETLTNDLFLKAITCVDQALKDSKLSKLEIHQIILVGGCTRIPRVQELLSEYFNHKTLNYKLHPDEAVAYGAAIQAALLTSRASTGAASVAGATKLKVDEDLNVGLMPRDLTLIDVAPLSLGLESAGGIMAPIIKRGHSIPCTKAEIFSTYNDNQRGVDIRIFEGERSMTVDNHLLGHFRLEEIENAKRGVPKIEVSFDVDTNGILKVIAVDQATGSHRDVTVTDRLSRLQRDELDRIIAVAEKFADDDRERRETVETRLAFENVCFNARDNNSRVQFDLEPEEFDEVTNLVDDNLTWIADNHFSSIEEIQTKMDLFKQTYRSLNNRYNKPTTNTSNSNSWRNAGGGGGGGAMGMNFMNMPGMGGFMNIPGMGGFTNMSNFKRTSTTTTTMPQTKTTSPPSSDSDEYDPVIELD